MEMESLDLHEASMCDTSKDCERKNDAQDRERRRREEVVHKKSPPYAAPSTQRTHTRGLLTMRHRER